MPEREDEIGALWERTSGKGTPFMTGKIGEQDVVLFRTNSDNPKAPAWRIYKSQPRENSRRETPSRRYEGHDDGPDY